ncbi:MAG: hypothetical protein IT379_14990 [Deltaproteobacteria bacterium]|nr:hypothetical protein [Deltaproteobacteria bacterium]
MDSHRSDRSPTAVKVVYTVVERPGGKSFWVRIGAAFTNRDGSLTVRLDALPTNGTLQVRDPMPERGAGAATGTDDIPF